MGGQSSTCENLRKELQKAQKIIETADSLDGLPLELSHSLCCCLERIEEQKKQCIETSSYDDGLRSLAEEVQNAAHAILGSYLDFRDDFPSEK
jgi:hypothetical protein